MNGNKSSAYTFWKLMEAYEVTVPPLQRDYAQGRERNAEIEQIRNSLVDEIYEALVSDKPLVLNFIYGEKTDGYFIPIDGQQRLTTLFLLHWYVFKRADYSEGLDRLKGFSYQTRVTSKRFCENLCNALVDFTEERISTEIRECYWLTGNFLKDPTVKSMLTMLDTIHRKFRAYDDFKSLKEKLTAEDCPISFLWLPMEHFQKTNDLYIKMNARGKLLSDFEIFKAKLQNSAMMQEILGANVAKQEVIRYIGRYNNQYAEFFYHLFPDASYDEAMLVFLKEMIRDSYLAYVSCCHVPQKDYREEYQRIREMNGSLFFRYIENGGKGFAQCLDARTAIVRGIQNATTLIEMFDAMPEPLVFENTLPKEYYAEKALFLKNYQADTLSDDVLRFATYYYLLKFKIPQDYESKKAYCMWKRFVYNVVTNSPLKSRREDTCEAFVFFFDVIDSLESAKEEAILKAISQLTEGQMTAAMKVQVKEEVLKASLMADPAWKEQIFAAESYFQDGQIGFLLDCCEEGRGTWDMQSFEKYVGLYKTFFDKDKRLVSSVDEKLFERGLLCMPDSSKNHTAHLLKQPNAATSWGFLGNNYKEFLTNANDRKNRQILKELLDKLEGASDFNSALTDIIEEIEEKDFQGADAWKLPFIREDLFGARMGNYSFRNCINLSENRKEVLLIAGTTVRAYSMELYTYLLYRELERQRIDNVKLVLYTTAAMNDHEGFPLRYIETENAEIGYSYADEDAAHPYLFRTDTGVEKLNFKEAIAKLRG